MGAGADRGVHPFAPQLHVTREALAALANSASPARGPYLPYPRVAASTWGFGVPGGSASLAGKQLLQLCDRVGPISGIAAARWAALSWDPHEPVALTDSAEARDPRGGGYRVGEHPSPLQGKEEALPGGGSGARGQGWATKRCPFGGSVALAWLRKTVERVPQEPGCSAHPPAPHAALNSLVTKSAWSPRGYLA